MRPSAFLTALVLLTSADTASAQPTGDEWPRLVSQQGHYHDIEHVGFSPDGRHLVSATMLGDIRVHEIASGLVVGATRMQPVFNAMPMGLGAIAFAASGTRVVAAGQSGVEVWDLRTGQVTPLEDEYRVPRAVALADDSGSRELSGEVYVAEDNVLVDDEWERGPFRAFDAQTWAERRMGVEAEWDVVSVDGRRAATADPSGRIRVYDTVDGAVVGEVVSSGGVLVALGPHGRVALLSLERERVGVLDLDTGRLVEQSHPDECEAEAVSAAGASIAWTCWTDEGRVALVTEVPSGAGVLRLIPDLGADFAEAGLTEGGNDTNPLYSLALMSGVEDAILVVVTGHDGTPRVVNADTGAPVVRPAPTLVGTSPGGKMIVALLSGGQVRVWDAASGAVVGEVGGVGADLRAIAVDADGSRVAAIRANPGESVGAVSVIDVRSGADVLSRRLDRSAPPTSVELSPTGDHLAVEYGSGKYTSLDVWDLDTRQLVVDGWPGFLPVSPFTNDGRVAVENLVGVYSGTTWDVVLIDLATGGATTTVSVEGRGSAPALLGRNLDLLVTSGSDGSSQLWSTETGEQLATVFDDADGSWLVVTPDGRFDAPDLEAIDGAVWVAPDDPLTPLPIEAFMREYYEPRLLPRVLAGETFRDMGSLLEKNRVQPRVEITGTARADDSTATVTVSVEGLARTYADSTRSSGVQDLRLFRDGQLVGWTPTDSTLVEGVGTWERTFTVPLASGDTTAAFSAYAFNHDLVKSRTARAALAVPDPPQRPRRAFVVSFGVDAFANDAWDLTFAAADARAYASKLDSTLTATGYYGDDGDDGVVSVALVSDDSTSHGSASALRGALLRLAGDPLDAEADSALALVPGADGLRRATPDDVVIVTASTHGYTSARGDDAGVFYLLPSDVPSDGPRSMIDAVREAAISSDELSLWLRGVDAGTIAVVVDACNAAGAVDGGEFKPGPMGARGLGQLAFDKGAAVLTATQADAPAIEAGRLRHGLLTYALVENGLLAGQADSTANADGRTTLAEWLAYGIERVPRLFEEVRDDRVETYGRGGQAVSEGGLQTRMVGPDVEGEEAGVQTPALFDFRRDPPAVPVAGPGRPEGARSRGGQAP